MIKVVKLYGSLKQDEQILNAMESQGWRLINVVYNAYKFDLLAYLLKETPLEVAPDPRNDARPRGPISRGKGK